MPTGWIIVVYLILCYLGKKHHIMCILCVCVWGGEGIGRAQIGQWVSGVRGRGGGGG